VPAAQVGLDGLGVGVVALAGDGVADAVAVGEEAAGVQGDGGEQHQGHRARHPPQLRHRPRQRQHAGPDHRRDDVRRRRPHRSCQKDMAETSTKCAGIKLSQMREENALASSI
jgi:hypothetical protein